MRIIVILLTMVQCVMCCSQEHISKEMIELNLKKLNNSWKFYSITCVFFGNVVYLCSRAMWGASGALSPTSRYSRTESRPRCGVWKAVAVK